MPESGGGLIHLARGQNPSLSGDGIKVRQFWQTSSDGGKTWQVAFDGVYAKSH